MAQPVPTAPDRTIQAVGARRAAPPDPTVKEIVARLRSLASAGEGLVALFDARAVAGERHVLSAWAHLGRARSRGIERLRDRGAELALFLAGDDQLPRALDRVGVHDDTEAFVLVAEKPRQLGPLLAAFGLRPDPAAYPQPPTSETLRRLGIGAQEVRVVPEAAWEGLVLERVALVELTAPHRPADHRAPTSDSRSSEASASTGSARSGASSVGVAAKKH